MRHRVVKNTLGRDKEHRKALMSNLSSQLIEHEKINTTLPKAKALRPFVEKLITKAIKPHKGGDKIDKFNTVKDLRKYLRNEEAIRKLIEEVAPRFLDRDGGYTRIIKTGERDGDKAPMARIELVKGNEVKKETKKVVPSKKKASKDEK
ncbi:50S ribosomal protein L17 [Patescibacteria group bacterium]|nr:50S ribosomal protein L17 [Patescibacteria group bacterium]